jgi:hypothetical protein
MSLHTLRSEHVDYARIVAKGGKRPFNGFWEIAAILVIAAIHGRGNWLSVGELWPP